MASTAPSAQWGQLLKLSGYVRGLGWSLASSNNMHCLPACPFALLLLLGLDTSWEEGGSWGATRQHSIANPPYHLFNQLQSVTSGTQSLYTICSRNTKDPKTQYTHNQAGSPHTSLADTPPCAAVRLRADICHLQPDQAMRDTELEKAVQRCCMLMGCFVPSQAYMPLLLTQLHTAADTAAEGAVVATLTALTQGAGKLTPRNYS